MTQIKAFYEFACSHPGITKNSHIHKEEQLMDIGLKRQRDQDSQIVSEYWGFMLFKQIMPYSQKIQVQL